MRSWIFVPPLSGRATCLAMGWQHPVYFIFYPSLFRTHLSAQSAVVIRMSHCWSRRHQTRELYIEAESFNVKWKPEKRERCDAKNYTADVGHWHSQVLWDYLLFGCYSILISFQHQHWSSQHIKWTEHRSYVCSVFVPFSINRSLCPNVGARGQHTPACLPRSEACHYPGLERLAHNRELPANCGQIQTANRDH